MGAVLKQLKKTKGKVNPSSVDPKLMQAWNAGYNRGFSEGVKLQREKDIESTVTMLECLENIPGIDEKTAWKIREHVMKQFGGQDNGKLSR